MEGRTRQQANLKTLPSGCDANSEWLAAAEPLIIPTIREVKSNYSCWLHCKEKTLTLVRDKLPHNVHTHCRSTKTWGHTRQALHSRAFFVWTGSTKLKILLRANELVINFFFCQPRPLASGSVCVCIKRGILSFDAQNGPIACRLLQSRGTGFIMHSHEGY